MGSGSGSARTTGYFSAWKAPSAAATASISSSGSVMSSNHTPEKHAKSWACVLLVLGVGLAGISGGRAAAPKFFPDDPIQIDDDRAFDAREAQPIEGSNAYDFAEHTF